MTSPEWEAANEDDSDRFPQTSQESARPATESHEQGTDEAGASICEPCSREDLTAASAAAVEAAQKELGCSRHHWKYTSTVVAYDYCIQHRDPLSLLSWTDRGCPVAVRVADAVVEALGLTVETQREHVPHYGSFSDHRCGDPTEPCRTFIRTRYESEWCEVEVEPQG